VILLMLGFAFFFIFESAAMIVFYSARRWQAPRRIVLLTTGVDVQRGERNRRVRTDRWTVAGIVANVTLRASFMVVGVVLLTRGGFEGQNLFWLLFARYLCGVTRACSRRPASDVRGSVEDWRVACRG
jgi:hypothetical protein